MKKFTKLLLTAVICMILATTALAADDIFWGFDIKGETEGWSKTNCTYEVTDGTLTGQAQTNQIGNYDPYVHRVVDFKAEDYPYIVFAMKHENERVTSNTVNIYFKTDTAGLSEATRVGNPTVDGKSSNGEFLVYVFDMSTNENWKGTVQTIRIDMLNAAGTYAFDYIKVSSVLPEQFDNITQGSSGEGQGGKVTQGFDMVNTYKAGQFTDVAASDWYDSSVAGAYELGFMNGDSATTFNPEGTLTVAEAVTIASRIHNSFNKAGAEFAATGTQWYDTYVNYAKDNGFFETISFDNYDRNIKRYEMAVLFGSILPEKWLPAINSVGYIPDIAVDADYKAAIVRLYNAGILMGSDEYGSFYPDNDITRAEAAAIINRLAIADKRVKGTLKLEKDFLKTKEPSETGYYLIDNPNMIYGAEGLQQSWQYSYEGLKPNYTGAVTNSLDDISDKYGNFIRRAINTQKNGVLDLSANFKISYETDGVYLSMCDASGKKLMYVYTKNGVYNVLSAGKEVAVGYPVKLNTNVWMDAYVDLDAKKFELFIDGAYCGTYDFAESAASADYVEFGTTAEGMPMVVFQSTFLRKNYYVADDFNSGEKNFFELKGDVTINGILEAKTASGKSASAKTSFADASGNLILQTLFYADKMADGISFKLTKDTEDALVLTTKDGKFAGLEKDVPANLWNLLRIEANTETDKATVKLNGKVIGEVAFTKAVDAVNGLAVVVDPSSPVNFKMDEVWLCEQFEYEDYCPEPVVNESKDHILGINMCSLWREGYHRGWNCISPYEEVIPVIGFYDEGIPEVSDWEIKFMAEHGIDYQLLCWYGDGRNGPVKLGRGGISATHDGYFNAKYSGMVKFAIMWENSSVSTTLEAFKQNVVPYWVEYYLTDDRYMTVNNKPVVTIWSVGGLINSMGGAENVKEAINYLKETCKGLGYDGCLFMCADGHSTRPDQFIQLASIGADATYAYHWNQGGVYWHNQTGRMNNYLKYNADPSVPSEQKIPLVPTVSVGFNSLGWHKKRTGLIDDEGWQKVADFAKSDVLPTLKGTDMENMVIISTWNEYGEGHYMMPSEGLGFQYLNNVAKAFTDNPENEDVVPTESQKARLGYLYPDNQYALAPLLNEDISEYPQTVEHQIKFTKDNLGEYEMYSLGGTQYINDFDNLAASAQGNAIIYNKQPLDINIDNCSYVRVTMKGVNEDSPADNLNGYFFFATDSYPNVEEPTRTAFTYPNGGDMATYYVNIGANSRWHGTLKTLRIDPISGGTFEIQSIEILRDDAKIPVKVNGNTLKTYGVPNTDNGQLLIPAYPSYGTFTALSAYHYWDKATQTLTVKANGHEVKMTVGSDKAIVDGKEETMYTKLELFDNLPLLPYDLLVEYLGYEYNRTETEINITTPFAK